MYYYCIIKLLIKMRTIPAKTGNQRTLLCFGKYFRLICWQGWDYARIGGATRELYSQMLYLGKNAVEPRLCQHTMPKSKLSPKSCIQLHIESRRSCNRPQSIVKLKSCKIKKSF
jgi:hypothetical protein